MKKSVLVTGANGYIGSHVVKSLLDFNINVIACDINTNNIDDRAKIIKTNIFNKNTKIFDELDKPDICIHLAWRDGFVHNSNLHMEDLSNHYKFLKNILDGGLKHLTVMGTMHEVGYYIGKIDENTNCNPISMYGISKDSLRRSVFLMLKDRNITFQWLRAYYIYGDDERNNSIFAKLIKAEKENQEYFPLNSGKNQYDFIDINDLSKQISMSALQNKVNGIINCCSGKAISLGEKIEEFIKYNNFKIKVKYGVFPEREYDSSEIWGDDNKITKIIKQYN